MKELSPSDVVPLDGHPVRERFADFTYGYVSRDLTRRVLPLSNGAAADVAREALVRHVREPLPDSDAVELDTERDLDVVKSWLQELPVSSSTQVVVSWDASSAVITDWDLFVRHWDDFCRPSSDDTTVWSPGNPWTLCYWHHGLLRFDSQPHAV
jgi:hypothetical protein